MEFVPSPRGSSKQPDSSSHTSSGRMSSKGPSHSTPVKSFKGHSSDYQNRSVPSLRDLSSPTKPSATTTKLSVKKNLSVSLGPGTDTKTSSGARRYRGNTSASETELSKSLSSSQQAKMADFENQTIQKQRQELALMVAELRDRDRELNDMVTGHQKQLAAWEQDRHKILTLSDKSVKLEREIQSKNDEIRALVAKLRVIQCEDKDKSTALNNTQEQLVMMSEQQGQASLQLHDLEQRNRSLSSSVHDMSCAVGQLEAREQELLTVLQLKDRDLSEASTHIAEVGAKLKKMELQFQDAKAGESDYKRTATDWKNKCADQQREVDYTKKLLNRSEQRCDEQHVEIQKLRQEVSTLKKEVTLSMEREKRKDQLLDLQRSKQDRSDSELSSVRQLYERQQKDLSLLHVNLENTKDLLYKNNISVPGMGSIGLPRSSTQSRSPYRGTRSDTSYHGYNRDIEPHDDSIQYTTRSGQYTNNYDYSYTPGLEYGELSPRGQHGTPDHNGSSSSRLSDPRWQHGTPDHNGSSSTRLSDPRGQHGTPDHNASSSSRLSDPRGQHGTPDHNGSSSTRLSDPRGQHGTPDHNGSFSSRLSDNNLDLETPETPSTDRHRPASLTSSLGSGSHVKETDSPAIKLHKLLTESRDMVEELERSVGDKDTEGSQQDTQPSAPQDNQDQSLVEEKEDITTHTVTNGDGD